MLVWLNLHWIFEVNIFPPFKENQVQLEKQLKKKVSLFAEQINGLVAIW